MRTLMDILKSSMTSLYESLLDDEEDLVSKDITVADALGLQHSFVIINSSTSISAKKIDNCFRISNLNKDSKKYKDYEKYLTDGTYNLKRLKQLQPQTIKHLSQFTEIVCNAYIECNKDKEKLFFVLQPYLNKEYFNASNGLQSWMTILNDKRLPIGSIFHKELMNNSKNILIVKLTTSTRHKYENIHFVFCFNN